MNWLLIAVSLWGALAVAVAMITCRRIRLADQSVSGTLDDEIERLLRDADDELLAPTQP